MKFAVYAALVATSQAGRYADMVKQYQKPQVHKAEETVKEWIERAEDIAEDAEPAVNQRNERVVREWKEAEAREEKIKKTFATKAEKQLNWLGNEFEKNDKTAEAAWNKAGGPKDVETFEKNFQADLEDIAAIADQRRKALMAISNRPNQLAKLENQPISLSKSDLPTEAELDKAQATLTNWIERAEDIGERATPAVEARNKKIEDAYHLREHQNEKVFWEAVEDLEKAQHQFEKEIMDAQREFELACERDGSKADWDALMKQVQEDVAKMEKMYRNVQQLAIKVKTIQMASDKLTVSLGKMSAEMKKNPVDVKRVDAENAIIVNWVAKFEAIAAKAHDQDVRRKAKFQDAIEDREDDVEDIIEETLEDWEDNDYAFKNTVVDAQTEMEQRLKNEGVVADMEKLGKEIDATLHWMATSMFKINRNVQSLGHVSDKLNANLPTGAEVAARHDIATQWVSDLEDIEAKAAPIKAKQDAANKKAWGKFEHEFGENVMGTHDDLEDSDEKFWTGVVRAQDKMHDRFHREGIDARAKKLGDDIDAQLTAWGF